MKQVLYVNCCVRGEQSRTKQLADYFLEQLSKKEGYHIEEICLMDENLSYFSGDFFAQREVLIQQKVFDHPRFRYAKTFANADKIVIAAPFWDLSFPALLKVYIENLCVDGITFGCNEKGCFGTCKADEMLFITTRGGSYQDSMFEMGSRYLWAMCDFFGIDAYDCVAADGLDLGLRPVEDILQDAKKELDTILQKF